MKTAYNGLEIAVIGLACKFPDAENSQIFWNNLIENKESIRRYTRQELIKNGVAPEQLENPNFVPASSYLKSKEYFDNDFFGYSRAEAFVMDPQMRLFHECAWSALEDASFDFESKERLVGVFVGSRNRYLWEKFVSENEAPFEVDDLTKTTLTKANFLPTRISYKMNLRGPSIFMDTACSTSLMTINRACNSLLLGECNIAVAGGVTLTHFGVNGYSYAEGGPFSNDGYCRPFDAQASGTVTGDGVGVVVLKPLEQAMQDKDHIYAIVKGGGVNNDGNDKVNYYAPSINGQAGAIKAALDFSQVAPHTISYVEAHGTATALGDPIEIEALKQVYGNSPNQRCGIGSVKSNIGHLDSAAGVASFIKTALALKEGIIPASLHFKELNPNIDLDGSSFYVQHENTAWPVSDDQPKRAGISSFGIGGTNVHLIMEEPPKPEVATAQDRRPMVVNISAKNRSALTKKISDLAQHLEHHKCPLPGVTRTLRSRATFDFRYTEVASNTDELAEKLKQYVPDPELKPITKQRKVFLFPGAGIQYPFMLKELYDTYPVFKVHLDECRALIRSAINFDLFDILYPEQGNDSSRQLAEVRNMLLAVYSVEYAMSQLIIDLGITPDILLGHSLGEYVAATVAGIFTLEDALKVVAKRGQLIEGLRGGKMASILDSEAAIQPLIAHDDDLYLAAINGPSSCVVSGTSEAINRLEVTLSQQEFSYKILDVNAAGHSGLMDPILDEFEEALKRISYGEPRYQIVSNLSGEPAEHKMRNSKYWRDHLRNTVRFADSVSFLLKDGGPKLFIEMGPGRTLSTLVESQLSDETAVELLTPIPKKGQTDVALVPSFLQTLGKSWALGIDIKWDRLGDPEAIKTPLPTYPFHGNRFPAFIKPGERQAVSATPLEDLIYVTTPEANTNDIRSYEWHLNQAQNALIIGSREAVEELTLTLDNSYRQVIKVAFEDLDLSSQQLFFDGLSDNLSQTSWYSSDAKAVDLFFLSELLEHVSSQESLRQHTQYFFGLMYLLQWFNYQFPEINIRMHIGLKGFEIGSNSPAFLRGLYHGIAKSAVAEYPNVAVKVIDFESIAELSAAQGSDKAEPGDTDPDGQWSETYVNGQGFKSPRRTALLPKNGVCVVIGGLGGVGFVTAKMLLELYEVRVVVVTRKNTSKSLSPEKARKVNFLENHPKAELFHADITHFEELQAAFQHTVRVHGQVNGVFFAAGAIDYEGIIASREFKRVNSVLSSKVDTCNHLIELLKTEVQVDFVLINSSLAHFQKESSFGQVVYTAGNEVLDAFAHHLQASGITESLLIHWCTWTDTGMILEIEKKKGEAEADRFRKFGINQKEGEQLIDEILRIQANDFSVSRKDLWSTVVNDTEDESETAVEVLPKSERPALQGQPVAPISQTEKDLVKLWENFFWISPIGCEDNFLELGGDSLKAISLLRKVKQEIGEGLSLPKFLKDPTIKGISKQLEYSEGMTAHMTLTSVRELPCLPAQQRVYLDHMIDDTGVAYNMPQLLEIPTNWTLEALQYAMEVVFTKHPFLLASFSEVEGELRQKIPEGRKFALEALQLETLQPDQVINDLTRPFNLKNEPLVRATYLTFEDRKLLFMDFHHIVADGVSVSLIMQEIGALMKAGTTIGAHESDDSFAQYVTEYNNRRHSKAFEEAKTAWTKAFEGKIPSSNFPFQATAANLPEYQGRNYEVLLEEETRSAVEKFCAKNHVSINSFLFACYSIMIARISNTEDLIVGTVDSGRNNPEHFHTVGMMVNTLAIRLKPNINKPISEYLKEVHYALIEALEHNIYTIEDLLKHLRDTDAIASNRLLDFVFITQNTAEKPDPSDEPDVQVASAKRRTAKFPLTLYFRWGAQSKLIFEYQEKYFDPSLIAALGELLPVLINQVINMQQGQIKQLKLVTEHLSLPQEDNDLTTFFTTFQKSAERQANRIALLHNDQEKSYSELWDEVNEFSGKLRAHVGRSEAKVAICMTRGIQQVVAMLAVMQNGYTYIPIDPHNPLDRVKYILQDSRAALLLFDQENEHWVHELEFAHPLAYEDLLGRKESEKLPTRIDLAANAMIIYTSGSTGQPKGVQISHHNFNVFLNAFQKRMVLTDQEVFMNVTSFAFDIFAVEVHLPLMIGAQVVIVDDGNKHRGKDVAELIAEHRVSVLQFTPSHAQSLLDTGFEYADLHMVNKLFCGGEILKDETYQKLQKLFSGPIYNLYGPTEATVWSSAKQLDPQEKVTIGQPLPGYDFQILNPEGLPLPAGITGDLYIGGSAVSKGYWGKSTLTSQLFKAISYSSDTVYFKTGDRARALPNGDYEFHGRKDDQLKINGYRIEPGEIQKYMNTYKEIRDSLVIKKEQDNRQMLVAFYVADAELPQGEIRKYLMEHLPPYMLPHEFYLLEKFPLTTNGKLNRTALNEMMMKRSSEAQNAILEDELTLTEQQIRRIWAEVLQAESNYLSIDEDFYAMGGHSLLIPQLAERLSQFYGTSVDIRDLFRNRTIRSQAAILQKVDQ